MADHGWRKRAAELLAERRPGYSLPQGFYVDPAIHEADCKGVFGTQWLFAANVCEVPEPGDFLTMAIGRNSIVVVRDHGDVVRAFHNTCRHRGSRLCLTEKGSAARLTCPYHQWAYGLDGRLVHTTDMGPDFDPTGMGLKPVHVTVICGLIYVCLADTPPDIEHFRRTVTPYLAPHRPERTKVAAVSTLIEKANWKLVIENNRECYHCSGNHPELLVSLVDFPSPAAAGASTALDDLLAKSRERWGQQGLPSMPADGGLEFRCIRLPFQPGNVSMTMDGKPACKKLLGELTEPDLGSVRMFHVPNNWNHFLADHIIHFRVTPLGPEETMVRTTWLVHEDAVEGWDYDPARLREVWDVTNDQDRRLAENNQLGIASDAYEPGPYAPEAEAMVSNFVEWYARALEDAVRPPRAVAVAAE